MLTTFGFRDIRFVERTSHSPAAAMVPQNGDGLPFSSKPFALV